MTFLWNILLHYCNNCIKYDEDVIDKDNAYAAINYLRNIVFTDILFNKKSEPKGLKWKIGVKYNLSEIDPLNIDTILSTTFANDTNCDILISYIFHLFNRPDFFDDVSPLYKRTDETEYSFITIQSLIANKILEIDNT